MECLTGKIGTWLTSKPGSHPFGLGSKPVAGVLAGRFRKYQNPVVICLELGFQGDARGI